MDELEKGFALRRHEQIYLFSQFKKSPPSHAMAEPPCLRTVEEVTVVHIQFLRQRTELPVSGAVGAGQSTALITASMTGPSVNFFSTKQFLVGNKCSEWISVLHSCKIF